MYIKGDVLLFPRLKCSAVGVRSLTALLLFLVVLSSFINLWKFCGTHPVGACWFISSFSFRYK